MPTNQSNGGKSLIRVPSSQMCQVDKQDEPPQLHIHLLLCKITIVTQLGFVS